MDVMDELRQLIRDSRQNLPFKTNNIRCELDFKIVPATLFSDSKKFIDNCMEGREGFICELFNHCYQKTKRSEDSDEVIFQKKDFALRVIEIADEKMLLYIGLPRDSAGCVEFCYAYIIAFRRKGDMIEDVKFFTLEDSMYAWKRIGTVSADGSHTHIGKPNGNLEDDLCIISGIAFQDT